MSTEEQIEMIQAIKNKPKKWRTLSAVLKEADRATTLKELDLLSDELVKYKRFYPLIQVEFGIEHIIDLGQYLENERITKKLFE